jgi:hypothetical protein
MRGLGVGRLFLTSTLVASLIASLLCGVVRGDGLSSGKSFRIRAAAFAPIGKVYSLGELSVNGRRVYGEQMIWGGELLQVSEDSRACVLLDSIGQVWLTRGAAVRLATQLSTPNGNTQRPVLIATLIVGDMTVSLQQGSLAYIEAGESVFSTTPGALFRIGVLEGRPLIDMARGDVSIEQQRRTRIKPRDVQVRPDGTIVEVATVPLNTKPNKRTQDRLRWMKSLDPAGGRTFTLVASHVRLMSAQTAPDETPVRDRLVKFEVVPPNLGTIQAGKTDARGIVLYTFNAGPNSGAGQIKATIESHPEDPPDTTTYETYSRDFNIEKLGFWRLRNKILFAIAAGGIACAIGCRPRNGPIIQQPPPTIP